MPLITMKSDASGEIGCGFHLGPLQRMHTCTADERPRSIAYKELLPVVMAARELGSSWSGSIVRAGVDNCSVVFMGNSGTSRAPDCMRLLRELSDLQSLHSFDLVFSYCPRFFNDRADSLSRLQAEWTPLSAGVRARFSPRSPW